MPWAILSASSCCQATGYDTIGVAPLIEGINFNALLGDKAFDANWIVEELDHRGAKVVISQRPQRVSPLAIDEEMYKWRHLIENWMPRRTHGFRRDGSVIGVGGVRRGPDRSVFC